MKIGIVGLGVVGSANYAGFELLGHKVFGHDIKFNSSIADVLPTDIVFVCVPTPSFENGSCDTTIVKSVIDDLEKAEEIKENVARYANTQNTTTRRRKVARSWE